ncbi:MAG: RNA-directed DNA polymerase [Pseudomonadota bacterium]
MSKPDTDQILRNGLLPDNLPPFLTTEQIADHFIFENSYQIDRKSIARPAAFNGSKRGFQRREFLVPHPSFVFDAALFYEKHWDDIRAHLDSSQGSVSTPSFETTTTRSLRFTPHSRLPEIRLSKLAKYRYCVVTDVSRCYPSIYTHSFPWALHGKNAAKNDRRIDSKAVYGNRLDFIFRQAQDGQTVGIPVGPDISRIAGEIILTAIDNKYSEGQPLDGYIRHVDDFWIGGDSLQDCEDKLHRLRKALNFYSLDANEQKTKIVPTSSIIGEVWPYEIEWQLEVALQDDIDERHDARIVSLLGSLVEYSTRNGDEGVIRFFIRKIDAWRKWDEHWDILEPFLAHCAVQFPHAFDYVARVVSWRVRRGMSVDSRLWRKVNADTIRSAAPLSRDSEVIWGLWLSKELDQRISKPTFDLIFENNGPLVLAVLAHFVKHNRINGKPSLEEFWSHVEDDGVAGAQWPLALELNHLGIQRPGEVQMFNHASLSSIFDAGLSMVDLEQPPSAFEDLDSIPDEALEGVGWGYEEDEEDIILPEEMYH